MLISCSYHKRTECKSILKTVFFLNFIIKLMKVFFLFDFGTWITTKHSVRLAEYQGNVEQVVFFTIFRYQYHPLFHYDDEYPLNLLWTPHLLSLFESKFVIFGNFRQCILQYLEQLRKIREKELIFNNLYRSLAHVFSIEHVKTLGARLKNAIDFERMCYIVFNALSGK